MYDKTSFVALGRISDDEIIQNELAGILALAWRCLHAEITHSRLDNIKINLDTAYKRVIYMAHSRYTSNASQWQEWVETKIHQYEPRVIPKKHHDKLVFEQGYEGDYVLNSHITNEVQRLRTAQN